MADRRNLVLKMSGDVTHDDGSPHSGFQLGGYYVGVHKDDLPAMQKALGDGMGVLIANHVALGQPDAPDAAPSVQRGKKK